MIRYTDNIFNLSLKKRFLIKKTRCFSTISIVGIVGIVGNFLLLGCAEKKPQPLPIPKQISVQFTDVTRKAGIQFIHNNGAFGKKWLPETMGSGCAFIDFNGDDWQDIILINSTDFDGHPTRLGKSTCALYKNKGDGTFIEVTKGSGLDIPMYGMGCAVGDYNNDGREDLYITALNRNYLFKNNGNGTFTDASDQADVRDSGWSSSAAFVDYNKDGWLDLFVCHYVKWTPETDIFFALDGKNKSYTTPDSYTGERPKLYKNNGNGSFTDVTEKAGILKTGEGKAVQGKSLGVAICDYNKDGWTDIAVANDTEPNYLYRNEAGSRFVEVGGRVGIAYSETGEARGAMGIDAADYDRSGNESLVIGNFSNQMLALYHNEGRELFIDQAPYTEVGQKSLLFLAFGVSFFDFDNDGWLDIIVANGHVEDDINKVQEDVTYAQRPLLFRNNGSGNFKEVGLNSGEAMRRPIVARGLAYSDYNLDGDLDILITTNGGSAVLLRNDGGNANHKLQLKLVGSSSNRSAIGAIVKVKVGNEQQRQTVRSGSSYCSQNELPITFGLGSATEVDEVEIQWPSGKVERLSKIKADQLITVQEGKGIIKKQRLG